MRLIFLDKIKKLNFILYKLGISIKMNSIINERFESDIHSITNSFDKMNITPLISPMPIGSIVELYFDFSKYETNPNGSISIEDICSDFASYIELENYKKNI